MHEKSIDKKTKLVLEKFDKLKSKKDFIDIYFLLGKYSLSELISFFEKKYKNIEYNKLHILKSLTYFIDAEDEPMPVMIKGAEWNEMKRKIVEEARKIVE